MKKGILKLSVVALLVFSTTAVLTSCGGDAAKKEAAKTETKCEAGKDAADKKCEGADKKCEAADKKCEAADKKCEAADKKCEGGKCEEGKCEGAKK